MKIAFVNDSYFFNSNRSILKTKQINFYFRLLFISIFLLHTISFNMISSLLRALSFQPNIVLFFFCSKCFYIWIISKRAKFDYIHWVSIQYQIFHTRREKARTSCLAFKGVKCARSLQFDDLYIRNRIYELWLTRKTVN